MTDDLSRLRALHDEASDLLAGNGAFMVAVRLLQRTWYAELLAATEVTKTLELAARLRALETIPSALKALMGDYAKAAKAARVANSGAANQGTANHG